MLELNSIFRRKNSLGRGFLGWVKFQKSPILELSSGCLGKYLTRSSVTALMVSQIFLCLLKSVRWHDLEQYLKKRRNLTKLKFEIMTWHVPDNSTSCTFGQPSFFSFFFNQSLFRLSASSTKNSKLKTHDFFVNFGRTCDFCLLFSNRKNIRFCLKKSVILQAWNCWWSWTKNSYRVTQNVDQGWRNLKKHFLSISTTKKGESYLRFVNIMPSSRRRVTHVQPRLRGLNFVKSCRWLIKPC